MRGVLAFAVLLLSLSTVPALVPVAAEESSARVELFRFEADLDGSTPFVFVEPFAVSGGFAELRVEGACASGMVARAVLAGASPPSGAAVVPVNDASCDGEAPDLETSRITSGSFVLSGAAHGAGSMVWVVSGVPYDPLAPPSLSHGEVVLAELDVVLDPSEPLVRHATLWLPEAVVGLDADAVCPTARGSITIVESDGAGAAVLNAHCDAVGRGGALPDVPAGNYRVLYEGAGAGVLQLRITGYPV